MSVRCWCDAQPINQLRCSVCDTQVGSPAWRLFKMWLCSTLPYAEFSSEGLLLTLNVCHLSMRCGVQMSTAFLWLQAPGVISLFVVRLPLGSTHAVPLVAASVQSKICKEVNFSRWPRGRHTLIQSLFLATMRVQLLIAGRGTRQA